MKVYTPQVDTHYYELRDFTTGKLILSFGVNFERKVGNEQEIINRIVELGYNPLLYIWKEA